MVYHSPFRTNIESHRIIRYGGFYSIILINQLIQLGNMMRAGCKSGAPPFASIHADYRSGFLDGLHRARTGYAAARTRHALEQIAVVICRPWRPSAACGNRADPRRWRP